MGKRGDESEFTVHKNKLYKVSLSFVENTIQTLCKPLSGVIKLIKKRELSMRKLSNITYGNLLGM